MIVEWYALKCFSLGVFMTWFLMSRWRKLTKTRTYYVESFIVIEPVRKKLREALWPKQHQKKPLAQKPKAP